jgi:hypothetical protein
MAKAPKSSPTADREILEAALHGLELQREKLDQQIAQVRSFLGSPARRPGRPSKNAVNGAGSSTGGTKVATKERRQLSPEARKRIAAAQKKRWAAFRKNQ